MNKLLKLYIPSENTGCTELINITRITHSQYIKQDIIEVSVIIKMCNLYVKLKCKTLIKTIAICLFSLIFGVDIHWLLFLCCLFYSIGYFLSKVQNNSTLIYIYSNIYINYNHKCNWKWVLWAILRSHAYFFLWLHGLSLASRQK